MILGFNLLSFHTRYARRLFVKSYDKPSDILEKLNQLAGYALDEEIVFAYFYILVRILIDFC